MHFRLTIFFIVFITLSVKANFEKDSTKLANFFQTALAEPPTNAPSFAAAQKLFSSRKPSKKWKETYAYLQARYFVLTGQFEKATTICNGALKLFPKSDKARAKFYNLLGSIQALKQDYTGAISHYKLSLALLENANDSLQAAFIKNNIANIFFSLTDYQRAYDYARDAYRVSKSLNDTLYMPSIAGVLSVSEVKLGKYESAFRHAQESLDLSTKYKQPLGLILANYSFGEYFLAQKNLKQSEFHFQQSLNFAVQFRQSMYILLNKIGLLTVDLQTKNYTQAIHTGEEALTIAQALNNQNVLYAIYKNLAFAYKGAGNDVKAYSFMRQAHDRYKQNVSESNQKKINELLIKYEAEKRKKELAKKALQLSNRNTTIAWLVLTIITSVFIAFIIIRSNRIRLKREREIKKQAVLHAIVEGEEKERQRLSHELHDGMASALAGLQYRISSLSNSNSEQIEIVSELQKLQENTRRMAHNLLSLELSENQWGKAMASFCTENSTEQMTVHYFGDFEEALLTGMEGQVFFRIIQELVHNARKYSQGSNCFVTVMGNTEQLSFSVEDNGIGMNQETIHVAQGLKTIRKRLAMFQTDLEIVSSSDKGTVVSFFVSKSALN